VSGLETRPEDLPQPIDDGKADHLNDVSIPSVALASTDGTQVNLNALKGTVVLYIYPMTGQPEVALPDEWDDIPGARGCTPQSCSVRDHMAELSEAGVSSLYGISTQTTDYQKEAAERLRLPFPLLSDAGLEFQSALDLPNFEIELPEQNNTLLKRMALIVRDQKVAKVFYPVFPPEQNASDVLDWLRNNPF
jgi:peroxiredoxin